MHGRRRDLQCSGGACHPSRTLIPKALVCHGALQLGDGRLSGVVIHPGPVRRNPDAPTDRPKYSGKSGKRRHSDL